MMNKRARLTLALFNAVYEAPDAERQELREALLDYETTYFRSQGHRAPLLRDVMDAVREGATAATAYEAGCSHEECTAHLTTEVVRVGFDKAEDLCLRDERADDASWGRV